MTTTISDASGTILATVTITPNKSRVTWKSGETDHAPTWWLHELLHDVRANRPDLTVTEVDG